MLVVWQGARRCLSCSGQRTHQGYQLRRHRGSLGDKLDRYQIGTRDDAALLLELKPPRILRQTEGPQPQPITKK
ncbi:uncharacterized protein LOC122530234 [Frieseomelitta varia]|uniref:uncharacterized protein LOC122530234 n=1 Tax=Frieseomelitta varia TaxID=561572 RepID=UPI001CB67FA9|nr:uncharacterized protein LOC122530234 [Frieseomelitta varia]